MSSQIRAVPDLCCIVTRRLVKSVGRVFGPQGPQAVVISATTILLFLPALPALRTLLCPLASCNKLTN